MQRIVERSLLVSLAIVFTLLSIPSCTHIKEDVDVMDPMDPMDTTIIDTMDVMPCDESLVYFENDVLPLLKSNCAISGCHDRITAEDGIILDSYDMILQSRVVEPFDIDESEILEVVLEDDEDKVMPPPPRSKLTTEQILLLSNWILQGARNDSCNVVSECDLEGITYSEHISPVLTNSCRGCHSGPQAQAGIKIENYSDVKSLVDNGTLLGVIEGQPGFTPMPFNGTPLSDCFQDQLNKWIGDGAQNN